MAKKSSRRSDTDKRKLAEKVEKLRVRLEKAESSTAKWKAEAKRLEVKAATRAKELKKLRKLGRAQPESAGGPTSSAVDVSTASTTSVVPDESWTVTRLRTSARELGVPGYSRMTTAALLDALTRPS